MKTYNTYITEASLGRVWQHANNTKIPFAIITAFRGNYSLEENVRRNKSLGADIRSAGYGHFLLDGHWVENKGSKEERWVQEDSIFIVGKENDNGKLKGLVKKWVTKWDQDAAIFKEEGGKDVSLIEKSGNQFSIGEFHPSKVADNYSKMRKGKGTFVFESAEVPQSWIGNLLEKYQNV